MRTLTATTKDARGIGAATRNGISGAAITRVGAGWVICAVALAFALAACQRSRERVAPAATSAAGYVYVTNNGDGTVSEFSRMADGSLVFQGLVRAGAVDGPTGIAISPSNRFAYVANEGNNRLYQFRIRRRDGALVPIGAGSVSTGKAGRPQHIAIVPDGRFAYVTNAGANKEVAGSIAQYAIDQSSGALKPIGVFSGIAVKRPFGIAAGHGGKFVYVSDRAAGAILSFAVQPAGTLKLAASTPSLGTKTGRPEMLAIDPGGGFLYAVDGRAAVVAVFKTGADGKLDFQDSYRIGESTGNPLGIALVSVGGNEFAYTSNRAIGTVSYFVVKQGVMTLLAQTTSGLGGPSGIAADPSGRFLYVVNRDAATVAGFDILHSRHGTAVLHSTIFNEDPANQSSHPLYIAMTR